LRGLIGLRQMDGLDNANAETQSRKGEAT